MSVINKIPRGLRVLIVIAVLCVLVWKFATGDYFYPGIGAAVVITALMIYFTYRSPRISSARTEKQKIKKTSDEDVAENLIEDENLESEPQEENPVPVTRVDGPAARVKQPLLSVKKAEIKPRATDVAAKYFQMSKTIEQERISEDWQPRTAERTRPETGISGPVKDQSILEEVPTDQIPIGETEIDQADNSSGPPVPIVEDETALSTEDQNQLVNAVWYRCENPFCKFTRFLGVHHIQDEKEGGTNKLDNLIVLCPYCHDLAHKKEIPEEEMKSWISNREERFKFKPEWHH
jgi:hypothetical protein